jgi:nucleotide-binding universal stress UspA family protein
MNGPILVALDGSPGAEAILPHALTLARTTGGDLVVVAVTTTHAPVAAETLVRGGVALQDRPGQAEYRGGREYLDRVVAGLEGGGVAVKVRVRSGDPVREILAQVAEGPRPQAVALATHGRGGLHRIFAGSVTERVLHDLPVPALLAHVADPPPPPPPARYRRILVPLDGSTFATQALDAAVALGKRCAAEIHLLTVLPPLEHLSIAEAGLTPFWVQEKHQHEADAATFALADMAYALEQTGLRAHTALRHGDPASGIVHFAHEMGSDLIVMATHGRGGLSRLWAGSVVMSVVRHTAVPILAIHPTHDPHTRVTGLA